jgi:hypothetical protein
MAGLADALLLVGHVLAAQGRRSQAIEFIKAALSVATLSGHLLDPAVRDIAIKAACGDEFLKENGSIVDNPVG